MHHGRHSATLYDNTSVQGAPVASNDRHQICARVPHHHAAPAAQSSSDSSGHICSLSAPGCSWRIDMHKATQTWCSDVHTPVSRRCSPVTERIEVGVLWLSANCCGVEQQLQGGAGPCQQGPWVSFTVRSGCAWLQSNSTPLPPGAPWLWRPPETTGPSIRARLWWHTLSWWA